MSMGLFQSLNYGHHKKKKEFKGYLVKKVEGDNEKIYETEKALFKEMTLEDIGNDNLFYKKNKREEKWKQVLIARLATGDSAGGIYDSISLLTENGSDIANGKIQLKYKSDGFQHRLFKKK